LAFADDIDIIGRTQKSMKEAFLNLERAADKLNLQINQNKTKFMPVTRMNATEDPVPGGNKYVNLAFQIGRVSNLRQ
jgi:hypothetical protein